MFKKISMAAAVLGIGASVWGKDAEAPASALKPDFAVNLYQQLSKEKGNLFVSPASIQSALAMAMLGAKAETARQMEAVLAVNDPAAFSAALASINKLRDPEEPPFKLTIANALWAQSGFPFEAEYVKRVRGLFEAEARELDFANAEASRQIINGWVEKKTEEKIKDLIAPGAITNETRLILTNAVYFNANWTESFEKAVTADAPFHAPGGVKTVPMMRKSERLGVVDNNDFHAVFLPYSNSTVEMMLLVPKAVDGLAVVEKALTPEFLGKLPEQRISKSVNLSLPRFKIEQSLSLKTVLSAMGMSEAFDGTKADFSGMTTADKLSISDVVHKAYVKVDEKGTEAAAATAVMMRALSAPMPEEQLNIVADRPFVFLVRDARTSAILFMGRVSDPG